MKFNATYFRSKSGVLSSALLFLLLISFICIVATGQSSGTQAAFLIATIVGFIVTGFFMAVRLFGLDETFKLPWVFYEFIYVIIWAIFFLVVAALALDFGGSYIAAGIFGLFTCFVYIAKIAFIYMTEVIKQNETPPPYPTI
nr:uncharacterized protein LOC111413253 [Onthophagus taurus]